MENVAFPRGLLEGSAADALLDNLFEGVYAVDSSGRIVYWNRAAEAITGFSPDEALSLRCCGGMLAHVTGDGSPLCSDRCPLDRVLSGGVAVVDEEVFLLHRKGHRVRVRIRAIPLTRDGRIDGVIQIFREEDGLASAYARIREMESLAFVDPLTGTGNRRHAEMILSGAEAALDRQSLVFGVLILDLDRFKGVNDTFGHDGGDAVLKAVAQSVLASIRPSDSLSRWGGDEFLVVLPGASVDELAAVGERIRAIVEASSPRVGAGIAKVTISGGAAAAVPGVSKEVVVSMADAALYRAKQQGRNMICIHEEAVD
jgi:diguanylate cyclase (GGDEF)-like protein/PAS domain S-box-containing protein